MYVEVAAVGLCQTSLINEYDDDNLVWVDNVNLVRRQMSPYCGAAKITRFVNFKTVAILTKFGTPKCRRRSEKLQSEVEFQHADPQTFRRCGGA